MRVRSAWLGLTVWCAVIPLGAAAQGVDRALAEQMEANRAGAAAQTRVDALDDETQALLREYRAVVREADALRAYNAELERLIAAQEAETAQVAREIEEAGTLEREVLPLLRRMVSTLGRFVEADAPFLPGERRARVGELEALLDRADVTVAEKFRRVLEAYEIEQHYGHTLEGYVGELEIDGDTRSVDFLRVGRVALFYRTTDGESAGAWDGERFVPLDRRTAAEIRDGLRIARRQAAPGLLLLPIRAPGAAP